MTELDFDELDKAVNSLMGDKNAAAKPRPTPPPASVTPAEPVSEVSTPATPTSSLSAPQAGRSAPPAVRRGGRFMDVVPATRKEPTPPISRQGTTMQPVSNPVSPESSSSDPKTTSVMPARPETEPTPAAPAVTTDWPDPLELVGTKKEETTTPIAPVDMPIPAEEAPSVPSQQEPLSSPFLPDAKVEKRPLGMGLSESTGELMVEDENTQLPALPKDVEPALPEELHGDVVSIEADNSTTDPSKHAPVPESPVVASKSDNESPKPKIPQVTVTEAAVPSGPVSIPQQYKEEPSSGEQKNGAIYDTDTYHQPLSHPAKKKSGWSWVVWILVILLIGAGGGAALYFMGIF